MTQFIASGSAQTLTAESSHEAHSEPPPKRRRLQHPHKTCAELDLKGPSGSDADQASQSPLAVAESQDDAELLIDGTLPSHPQGIKPLGNLYSASQPNLKTHAGSFATLPDELLVHVLEQLRPRELLNVGATCKGLHAFARHDELWKTLLVESPLANLREGQQLDWLGSWRATFLRLPRHIQASVDCTGLYSDTLYRPFHCAHLPLAQYTDPALFRSHIPKLEDLSHEEFKSAWADRPFILTKPVKTWEAYREWDLEKLRSQFREKVFRCEAVDWPMETYAQYQRSTADESPLYLFDSRFVEKMGLKVGQSNQASLPETQEDQDCDYLPPSGFYPDLFSVLGDQRPSHRWLIIGPARSGSSFHTDPNGTSAWNAVLKGRKYWIISPAPPPGVYVSEDESEVTSPSSIGEWLLGFHEEARNMPGVCEGICEEGEVLHVPGGWYHLVLNLPPSDGSFGDNIAITQNFVPEPRLPKVLRFLRDKPDQVSGFQFSDDNQDEGNAASASNFNAYELLVSRLNERHPGLVEKALQDMSTNDEASSSDAKKGVWEQVVEEKEVGGGGFSFGFGFGDDDEDVP